MASTKRLVRLAAGLVFALFSAAAGAAPVTVDTDLGPVQGESLSGYSAFLGIPYAAPPVGALRWVRPQPHAPWTAPLDATQFGSICPQPSTDAGGTTTIIGAEDCLFLNLYVPSGTAALPVMVFIHGGSGIEGAGSFYDGSVLAERAGALVVTINYRLGSLGQLAHPALSAEAADAASGNYSLADQQAALGWVQANIAGFGGDPANVTLFGQSAGGIGVCMNLVSPAAAGLFAKGIIESGPCLTALPSLAAAEASGIGFGISAGCPDDSNAASCLRALPVSALLNPGIAQNAPVTGGWGFTQDGALLPRQPQDALQAGAFNKMPMIIGSNHDEFRLAVAQVFDLPGHPITAQSYRPIVTALASTAAPAILKTYPLWNYASPDLAFGTIFTDYGFSCPSRTMTRILAPQVPVFAYEFDDIAAPAPFADPYMPLGAYHTAELLYVFQSDITAISPLLSTPAQLNPAQLELSDQIMRYWGRFAATGDPNQAGTDPAWPQYALSGDTGLLLAPGRTQSTGDFWRDHKCTFWAGPYP
jgi:para-nitrobenzyl esterase